MSDPDWLVCALDRVLESLDDPPRLVDPVVQRNGPLVEVSLGRPGNNQKDANALVFELLEIV